MPYILAVLALVIIGISTPFLSSKVEVITEEVTEVPKELIEDTIVEKIAILADEATGTEETKEETPDEEQTLPADTAVTVDTTPAPSNLPGNTQTKPSTPASTYADGTYTASKTYRTPEGSYTMNVSLTVANDTVTAVSTTFDSKAQRDGYTKRFSNSYQSYVLGKDLESVSLSRVGGASLTTGAFNSALSSIRSQAS